MENMKGLHRPTSSDSFETAYKHAFLTKDPTIQENWPFLDPTVVSTLHELMHKFYWPSQF